MVATALRLGRGRRVAFRRSERVPEEDVQPPSGALNTPLRRRMAAGWELDARVTNDATPDAVWRRSVGGRYAPGTS